MCIAVCYIHDPKTIITHFAQPKALLPVKTKAQNMQLVSWGRRIDEKGSLPLGGWASLDSIKQGKWDQFFPKSVKIPVHKFMEQNVEGCSLWFDVTAGHWIQGLLIQHHQEQRVYIVTITPELPENPYQRWPRILCD